MYQGVSGPQTARCNGNPPLDKWLSRSTEIRKDVLVFVLIDLTNTKYASQISYGATAKSPSCFDTIHSAQYEWDTFQDMIEGLIGIETLLSQVITHAT